MVDQSSGANDFNPGDLPPNFESRSHITSLYPSLFFLSLNITKSVFTFQSLHSKGKDRLGY